jgi:hypothetical protein
MVGFWKLHKDVADKFIERTLKSLKEPILNQIANIISTES